jgi:hypothetical protein
MTQAPAGHTVEVFDRRKFSLFMIAGGPVLIGGLVVMLLSGDAWRRDPWFVALGVATLPLMAVGWWSYVSRRRTRAPALRIQPSGVRINMLLAPVPWIPRDQFGGLDIERRAIAGASYSWIRVQVVDKAALTAGLPWPRRLLLLIEGGRVRVPASNLDRSPDEIAAAIRELVMSRPDTTPTTRATG